jgi:hypothetical protein
MYDLVSFGPDGLGPCTSVECLLNASVETARTFMFEKSMMIEAGHGGAYDEMDGKMNDNMCENECYDMMQTMKFSSEKDSQEYLNSCMMKCSSGEMDHNGYPKDGTKGDYDTAND